MPKTHGTTDLSMYALVADRILLFYEKYPKGQILTDLISRENGEITFRARVYRDPEDRRPSATGWASETIGDGEINEVACIENTETSAVGRALANLAFTASRLRPSAEEMLKAARARERLEATRQQSRSRMVREVPRRPTPDRESIRADARLLLGELERAGMPLEKLQEAVDALKDPELSHDRLERIERTLRRWVQEQRQSIPGIYTQKN